MKLVWAPKDATCMVCGRECSGFVIQIDSPSAGMLYMCEDCARTGWKATQEWEAEEKLRFKRAALWARDLSLGPWGQGVSEDECRKIEVLRDRILEIGEEAAWDELGIDDEEEPGG